MPIKAGYLLAAGGGAILFWSGVKGHKWSTVLRDLIAGKQIGSPNLPITSASNLTTQQQQNIGNPAINYGYGSSSGGVWNQASLQGLWIAAGGSSSTARNAACHAMQESSGNARITSSNPDGGENVGLWQLDTKGVGSGYTVAQLMNPWTNARITVRATNNGRDWSEWATPGCQ